MAATEAQIRDYLSQHLELLEKGLVLIQTEYPLQAAIGAKGFIDILARDSFGSRVIIELKRSNQAARQAIHEIFKYVALFKEENRLAESKIRCFVVSTEWHELTMPFAELVHSSQIQMKGFHIEVNEAGHITNVSIETAAKLATPLKVFRAHGCFLFSDAQHRDASVDLLKKAVEVTGGYAAFIALLDASPNDQGIVYPHAIYLVPGELDSTTRQKAITQLLADGDLSEDDLDDDIVDDERELQIEDTFHSMIMQNCDSVWDTYEIGYPEKFGSMLANGWNVKRLERFGTVPSEAAAEDSEILQLITGIEGQNATVFYKLSTPTLQSNWAATCEQMTYCLKGNERWMKACLHFVNEIANNFPNATVSFAIYNPLAFPYTLFKLATLGDVRYLPYLELVAHDSENEKVLFLLGRIEWEGTFGPQSIESVYSGELESLENYIFALGMHLVWDCDEQLLARHGMYYATVKGEIANEKVTTQAVTYTQNSETGKTSETPTSEGKGLSDFIEANPAFVRDFVNEICQKTTLGIEAKYE